MHARYGITKQLHAPILHWGVSSNAADLVVSINGREAGWQGLHLALVGKVGREDDARVLGANSNVTILPALVEHEGTKCPATQLLVSGSACDASTLQN